MKEFLELGYLLGSYYKGPYKKVTVYIKKTILISKIIKKEILDN